MKKIASIVFLIFFVSVVMVTAQSQSYDLKHWPKEKSPKEIGTQISEKFLNAPNSLYGNTHPKTPPTQITYPDVCTWLGGMWFAEVTKNNELYTRFENRFTPLLDKEANLLPKPNHVDNNVFGSIPLELYMKTKQQKYLDLGLKYADKQWELPDNAKPEEKSWADQGYSWQTRVWIDDMFMITVLQAQAFRATRDRKYIDRAAKEMVLYLDKIQLRNGLFYHSPDAHLSWGRGNGWMAVAILLVLGHAGINQAGLVRLFSSLCFGGNFRGDVRGHLFVMTVFHFKRSPAAGHGS